MAVGPEWAAVGQRTREFHLCPHAARAQAKEEIPLSGWVSPGIGSLLFHPFLILLVMISRTDFHRWLKDGWEHTAEGQRPAHTGTGHFNLHPQKIQVFRAALVTLGGDSQDHEAL